MAAQDTIFALSSGQPPAAIAVMRISGPEAGTALQALCGNLPAPRQASLRGLVHSETGATLDHALVLWFPGPDTATGEDLAELHLHGGRAVVRAVEACLADMNGLRAAIAGEFTRRAFLNGRMDLAEAEGLGDLLTAESELQRQAAMSALSGRFSRAIESWREDILKLSARVEAELDFSDEDDVSPGVPDALKAEAGALHSAIDAVLDQPSAEKLKEGIRVVLAGPPNSGKSTLINRLTEKEAAIVSDIAGTTRDIIEVPVAFQGTPFVFTDTAGLRDAEGDAIEKIGIERARKVIGEADIVLWLGAEGEGPDHSMLWEIEAQVDGTPPYPKADADIRLSARTGENLDRLIEKLVSSAGTLLPPPDSFAVNQRQRMHLENVSAALGSVATLEDYLLIGEELRIARAALDGLLGNTHTEDMLDALFGRFCIGK